MTKTNKTNKTKNKLIYFAILFIFTFIFTFANILSVNALQINQIYYDAVGSDDGFEFIELYNPTDEIIKLSDYNLYTASSSTWDLIWSGKEVIFPKSYFKIGEMDPTDYTMNLNLQNSKGSIKLENKKTNETEIVGYGNAPFYSMTPAVDIDAGFSLLRISNTNNNSIDFVKSEVIQNNNVEDILVVAIINMPPKINNVNAIKEQNEYILKINASDDNGYDDIKKIEYNCIKDGINNLKKIDFKSNTNIECEGDLEIRLFDSNNLYSEWEKIDIKTDLFEIVSMSGCTVEPGTSCEIFLEILANEKLNFTVNVDKLYDGFDTIDVNLHEEELFNKGETKKIPLEMIIPKGTKSSLFQGLLDIEVEIIN